MSILNRLRELQQLCAESANENFAEVFGAAADEIERLTPPIFTDDGKANPHKCNALELVNWLKDGCYEVGHSIPSERNLAIVFGLSRATMRTSLVYLEGAGVLESAHGKSYIIKRL
jgi:hypothetical protein